MKRILAVFAVCAASAMAADMTGYIVDKNCSTKPAMLGDEACAKKCMDGGSPAVLATADGKIYKISNQDKVKASAGKKVTVTGKVDGDTITVDTIAPSKT
jgi:hypothetical protein